jgi:hypothetical protein
VITHHSTWRTRFSTVSFSADSNVSTHRLPTGRRLDLIHSTRHDELAASDYRLLQQHGILTARDGLRWHLIERTPHK